MHALPERPPFCPQRPRLDSALHATLCRAYSFSESDSELHSDPSTSSTCAGAGAFFFLALPEADRLVGGAPSGAQGIEAADLFWRGSLRSGRSRGLYWHSLTKWLSPPQHRHSWFSQRRSITFCETHFAQGQLLGATSPANRALIQLIWFATDIPITPLASRSGYFKKRIRVPCLHMRATVFSDISAGMVGRERVAIAVAEGVRVIEKRAASGADVKWLGCGDSRRF